MTVYTAGAASTLLAGGSLGGVGATMSAGMTVLGGGAGFGAAALSSAAIGGAVGNIAGQGVAIASGLQEHFSWRQVGQSALGSVITAGIGAAAQAGGTLSALNGTQPWQAAGRAALSSGVNQALHGNWSWREIVASAVGAGAGAAAGNALNGSALGNAMGSVGRRLAAGFAGGVAGQWAGPGGKANYGSAFASTLGSVLGDAIAAGMASDRDPSSWNYRNEMDRESDAYSPVFNYNYRNGSDVESDLASADRQRRDALYGLAGAGPVRLGTPPGEGVAQWSAAIDAMIRNGGSNSERALDFLFASTADASGTVGARAPLPATGAGGGRGSTVPPFALRDWGTINSDINAALDVAGMRAQEADVQRQVLDRMIGARRALPSDGDAISMLSSGHLSLDEYGKILEGRERLGTGIRIQYTNVKSTGAMPYGLYPEEMAGYAGGGIAFARGLSTTGRFSAETWQTGAARPVPRVDVGHRFVKTPRGDGGFDFDFGDPTTHGLQATISRNGTLSMDIRANPKLATAEGSGTDMAASLMNRLASEGIEVNKFSAQWMKGSKDVSANYAYYNSMRYKVGDMDAARGTWTGRFFSNYGFDIVTPPVIVNSPGKTVLATFVRVPR